jgi:hypothetical protein
MTDAPGTSVNDAPRICQHCGEQIEHLDGVGWVETRSGDEGGTYDICPERYDEANDEHGTHQPETA